MHMMIRKLSTNQPVRHPARSFTLWLVQSLGAGNAMAENLPVGWTGEFHAAASEASREMSHAHWNDGFGLAQLATDGRQPRAQRHFASHQGPTEHHVTIHEATRKTTRENLIGELAGHLGEIQLRVRDAATSVLTKAHTIL